MVELVAAPYGPIGTDERQTRQSQIANCIKRLVACEFVNKTQTFGIQDPVL